jgi:hypothetical protein
MNKNLTCTRVFIKDKHKQEEAGDEGQLEIPSAEELEANRTVYCMYNNIIIMYYQCKCKGMYY